MSERVMLCRDGDESDLHDPNNCSEEKFDGTRLKAERNGNKVRLVNRHGIVYSVRLPEIMRALLAIEEDFEVDGEVVHINPETGKAEFNRCQQRCATHYPDYWLIEQIPVTYKIFDIMRLKGQNVEKQPFEQRKKLLHELIEDYIDDTIQYVPYRRDCVEHFAEVKKAEGEGLILKNVNSPYVYERSYSWLKVKNWRFQTCNVVGWTEGKNSRRHFFGALVLEKDGKYIGKAGSGFNDWELAQIKDLLHNAKNVVHPFDIGDNYKAVETDLQVKVKYYEITGTNNVMRHPVFENIV